MPIVSSGQITITDANDGISIVSNRDNIIVPTNSSGVVASYADLEFTLKVYAGGVDDSANWTFLVSAVGSGIAYRDSDDGADRTGIGPTSGALTGTKGLVKVASLTTDSSYIEVTAIAWGKANLIKRVEVNKIRAGVDGVNGVSGQRGSRTYYVPLTGATATYSDSLATTTASEGGGPILRDTVVQYNNSENFSQTKFWDGAAWQIVNAVVDGNLLVPGTVGAGAIAADAVTAKHMLVTSHGRQLNLDPSFSDSTAWVFTSGGGGAAGVSFPSGQTDGIAGKTMLRLSNAIQVASLGRLPIVAGRKYRLTFYARKTSGTGGMYGRIYMNNAAGSWLAYAVTMDIDGTIENITVPATWTKYTGYITAPNNAVEAYISLFGNWGGTGITDFQDCRMEEYIGGDLVVQGSLKAEHIDTTGLVIKNNDGSVAFASGGAMVAAINSAVSPTNKVTGANASTLIDNAAIGNAQIGGAIYSTDYAEGHENEIGGWAISSLYGWGLWTNSDATYVAGPTHWVNANGAPTGYGSVRGSWSGGLTTSFTSCLYLSGYQIPCVAGEEIELQAYVMCFRGLAQLEVTWVNSQGQNISGTVIQTMTSSTANWSTNLADFTKLAGFATAPTNTAYAKLEVRIKRTSTADNTDLYVSLPYIGKKKRSGQLSTWPLGTGTGWKIDKDGRAMFGGDVTFRGKLNVQSSTWGERMEITPNQLRVFDSNGTCRVKIGNLLI